MKAEAEDVRQCARCNTKYTVIPGTSGPARWCPTCGSPEWVEAIASDYRTKEGP